MSEDPLLTTGSKYSRIPLVLILLALAATGGWMAGRLGEGAKARERENAARVRSEAELGDLRAALGRAEARMRILETPPAPPVPAAVTAPEPAPEPEAPKAVETIARAPAVLRVFTVPLGEVWVTDSTGPRPVGRADVTGAFKVETLPAGDYRLEVRHPDQPRMEAPVSVTLREGETVERLVVPPAAPGILMVFADEGAPLYVDGKKIGPGGTAVLGKVPTRRDLLVTLGEPGRETRRVLVRLEPKETRTVDLRTVAGAAKDRSEPGSDAPSLADGGLAVRVVSADRETGIIALARSAGGDAPMSAGNEGRFRAVGGDRSVKVRCVRVFGAVSVCRGEVFDVSGGAATGELLP